MICITSFGSAFQESQKNSEEKELDIKTISTGHIDITPQQAWDMMSTKDDGIQIPIDVRRLDEYTHERIIIPNDQQWIRWFPYELTSDGPGPIKNQGALLQIFMNIFDDKEIIIYCRTGRRTSISAQILVDNQFSGTVYNIVGGITEWKQVGLPTTLQ